MNSSFQSPQSPLKRVVLTSTMLQRNGYSFIQTMLKHSGGRPKKKMYHRVHDLDKVMDLQKKPSLILQLKNIIQSHKTHSILIRDLEKEVGFVNKWNFMALIEKYPSIFRADGGNGVPIKVRLTEKALRVAAEEVVARELMEPILVTNLRKLLMMSMECRIPIHKIELIESELGLPRDFKKCLIPKYPQFFSVKDFNGHDYLYLESWDSSLAISSREEDLNFIARSVSEGDQKKTAKISRDGSCSSPFAFKMSFPDGFRPNKGYLEEVHRWQKMAFPSPYLNARRFDFADPKARKRAVAVLHEVLSLTMEKRLNSAQLDAFHDEYQLPCKLLLCLVKNHGIFYITNKGARSTVFLKEAYDGLNLIEKCPLLRFQDKFVGIGINRDVRNDSERVIS
ncbi:hypothetical protein Sjap_009887 [Stephania japonica]|uniref:PORR domain-containing protein n=1 Tax=Stephania japonica TaxID=461633 RepID=A0AAP0P5W0_9MAGN